MGRARGSSAVQAAQDPEELDMSPAPLPPAPEPKPRPRGLMAFVRSFSSLSDHDAITWTPNPAFPQHAPTAAGGAGAEEKGGKHGAAAKKKAGSDDLSLSTSNGQQQISSPVSASHDVHVVYNAKLARFEGRNIPAEWKSLNQQFGVPITEVPKVDVPGYPSKIPAVLVMLKDKLLAGRGLESEGIFRLAPDKDECDAIKRKINAGTYGEDCRDSDVNCFANLIKVWFRDCPQALFDGIPESQMVKITALASHEQVASEVESLPEPQKSIIMWLLDLIGLVVLQESVNRMSARNMAIVMSPNLFRCSDGMDPMLAMIKSQVVSAFTLRLVESRMATSPQLRKAQPETPSAEPIVVDP